MIFIAILILTALAVASSAAYFSVFGLIHLFTGAVIPVAIMGTALEAGKLVAASFLYRYSKRIGIALKMYLAMAILVLMVITSIGIFGFLTAAYQKDTLPLAEMQQQITLYEEEQERLLERRNQMDEQVAQISPNYVTARRNLMADFQPERERIEARLEVITPALQEMKVQEIDTKAKVGPIMFVAEVFDRDPNSAVFWFIIILISVFDPLAVALTIAANVAIKARNEEKKKVEAETTVKVDKESLRNYIDKKITESKVEPEIKETPPT